jgi:hypothetical protein
MVVANKVQEVRETLRQAEKALDLCGSTFCVVPFRSDLLSRIPD